MNYEKNYHQIESNIFDKQYDINRDELSWYGGINLSNELELLQEISISKKIILNMVLIGVNNNLDSKMYKLEVTIIIIVL